MVRLLAAERRLTRSLNDQSPIAPGASTRAGPTSATSVPTPRGRGWIRPTSRPSSTSFPPSLLPRLTDGRTGLIGACRRPRSIATVRWFGGRTCRASRRRSSSCTAPWHRPSSPTWFVTPHLEAARDPDRPARARRQRSTVRPRLYATASPRPSAPSSTTPGSTKPNSWATAWAGRSRSRLAPPSGAGVRRLVVAEAKPGPAAAVYATVSAPAHLRSRPRMTGCRAATPPYSTSPAWRPTSSSATRAPCTEAPSGSCEERRRRWGAPQVASDAAHLHVVAIAARICRTRRGSGPRGCGSSSS